MAVKHRISEVHTGTGTTHSIPNTETTHDHEFRLGSLSPTLLVISPTSKGYIYHSKDTDNENFYLMGSQPSISFNWVAAMCEVEK